MHGTSESTQSIGIVSAVGKEAVDTLDHHFPPRCSTVHLRRLWRLFHFTYLAAGLLRARDVAENPR